MASLMERDVIRECLASAKAKKGRINIMMKDLGIVNEAFTEELKNDGHIFYEMGKRYLHTPLEELDFDKSIAEIKVFDDKYIPIKSALDVLRKKFEGIKVD